MKCGGRDKAKKKKKSGDYTVYYSRGERTDRGTAIVLHKKHSETCRSEDRA